MSDARTNSEPHPPSMRLVERDGFLAAEIEPDAGRLLTATDVREALERLRAERA